jgi:hypothetical protein
MQGDAVTVAAVDMGTHRNAPISLDKNGTPYAEVQGHCGCFTHGSVSGHECEVHPLIVRPWVAADLCPLKIPVDTSHVRVHNPFVRQMPRVPSESSRATGITGRSVRRKPAQESPSAR